MAMIHTLLAASQFFAFRNISPRSFLLELQCAYETGAMSRGEYEKQRDRILGCY